MKFEEFSSMCSKAQIAVLGPGRAGKTTFLYSFSQLGKTLAIESEEGAHVARPVINSRNLEIETIAKRVKKGDVWVSLPPEDQPKIRDRLDELIHMAYTGGYEYVVVDSLSDIAGHFEGEYARKTGNVSQNDWFKTIEGMKSLVRRLKEGSFHFVASCIAAPPREGSMIEITPSLPGQLKDQMLPMFQSIVMVVYDKETGGRRLVVNDPSRGICDRFHSFGSVMDVVLTDDPGWAAKKMIDAVGGKAVKPEEMPAQKSELSAKSSKIIIKR